MSEAIPEVAGEVVAALTPEARAVLEELHSAAMTELDALRQRLPQLEQAAVDHARSAAEELLDRFHRVLAHIEGKLAVHTETPAPVAADPTPAPSTTEASSAPSSETPGASSTTPTDTPASA